MGFGLPAAMGVQAALPDKLVIDIDGDGSMLMNVQELATLYCEKLPVKVLLLNNQHLGMVVQWEDRFHGGSRAHTYLGPIDDPASGRPGRRHARRRDVSQLREDCGRFRREGGPRPQQGRISRPPWLRCSTHDGPYLLDVICPYQEHVLPMIPSGRTVRDIIIE